MYSVWICPTGLKYTLSECFWEICGEKGEITYIYTVLYTVYSGQGTQHVD